MPLFQVLFALHNLPAQEIALSDLKLSWMEAEHGHRGLIWRWSCGCEARD